VCEFQNLPTVKCSHIYTVLMEEEPSITAQLAIKEASDLGKAVFFLDGNVYAIDDSFRHPGGNTVGIQSSRICS
jgi:hypothetical protein